MEQQTWLEVAKTRNKDLWNYANACTAEAAIMEKVLTRLERGEVDPSRLEKDAVLMHTILGVSEARKQELPAPGTLAYAVRRTAIELSKRKKGGSFTTEELIKAVQAALPDANPKTVASYCHTHKNDIRRKRDMRNVGPGAWVIDDSRMIEDKRKPTEDEVQDTVAMVIRSNKDTSPFKPYTKGSVADRVLRLMATAPKKQWTARELRAKLGIQEGHLAFLHSDQERDRVPFKKVAPGIWQLKRGRADLPNGKVPQINKKVWTKAEREAARKTAIESHKRRRAEKEAAEAAKLEKGETVNA